MKWIPLVVLVVVAMAGPLRAQEYRFEGTVQDAESEEPIPFARFQILPEGKSGFVADLNGNFSHLAMTQKLEVMVSSIGYETTRFELAAESSRLIRLQPAPISTDDVVITYIDQERALLQKVLDAIPENYPQENERITGRVIEQLATDSLYQDLIYSAEANIEADKLSYAKRNKYSTVRLLEGKVERHKPDYKPFTNIMAGAHNVHRFDVVASREPPLDNIYSKRYRFQLVDTTSYLGEALFKMRFETPTYEGALYIQDHTYALVKAEYTVKQEKVQDFAMRGSSSRLFLHFTTEYYQSDRLFRLSFINYRTGFSEQSRVPTKRIYLNNFFYLNRHTPSTAPIPFNDQINFSDRLVLELSPDSSAQSPGNAPQKILKNISLGSSLGLLAYQPVSELSALYASGFDGQLRGRVNEVLFVSHIKYRLRNAWGIAYVGGASINFTRRVNSHSLLMTWSHPLTRNQRWLFGIGAGANYLAAELETGEGLPFGDLLQYTPLEATRAQLIERNRQGNLIGNLQLKYRVSGNLYVALGSQLPLNVYSRFRVFAEQGELREVLYERDLRNRFRPGYYQLNLGIQLFM